MSIMRDRVIPGHCFFHPMYSPAWDGSLLKTG
jgi:hypothetical protein